MDKYTEAGRNRLEEEEKLRKSGGFYDETPPAQPAAPQFTEEDLPPPAAPVTPPPAPTKEQMLSDLLRKAKEARAVTDVGADTGNIASKYIERMGGAPANTTFFEGLKTQGAEDVDRLQRAKDLLAQSKPVDTAMTDYQRAMVGAKDRELKLKEEEAKTPKEKDLKPEMDLSKEYRKNPTTERTYEVREAFERVKAVTQAHTAASNLALIFNYMKMLDPRSVVRESEFRTAEQAKSWLSKVDAGVFGEVTIPSTIRTMIQKSKPSESGAFLLPEQVQDFKNEARNLMQAQLKVQKQVYDQYSGIAQNYGMDSQRALGKVLEMEEEEEGKGPSLTPEAPADDYDKMSDEELEKLLKQKGL